MTSFELLIFTEVVELRSGNVIRVLHMEPSVVYFSKEHLPYAVIALASLFIFVAAPMLLLTIYPRRFFRQFLSFSRIN